MHTEPRLEESGAVIVESVAAPAKKPLPELPASLKVISEYLEINYDTLRNKWIGKIESCYEGLDCPPIRDENKRVTAFGLEAIKEFLESKADKDYHLKLRSRYGDRLQQFHPAPVVASPQVKGGLMNLPCLSPVESVIVPCNRSLPTDNPAQVLATRSGQLATEGLAEIEILKNFLKEAVAVADGYIDNLDKTTSEAQRQAKEVENLAFELEVKVESVRRAEVRKEVAQSEVAKTKATAESNIANFADFFAKRSRQNVSS